MMDSPARIKPEMAASSLLGILRRLAETHTEIWLDGGWGVDALLGYQSRSHEDVDLVLRVSDVPSLIRALEPTGFTTITGSVPHSFVLENRTGLAVDVHSVRFDREGNGIYRMQNGVDWVYPAAGFAGQGVVQGREVLCLTPAVQVLCHAHGYSPGDTDFRDMELLALAFDLELPPQLRRPRQ